VVVAGRTTNRAPGTCSARYRPAPR
jgi:hypothetical protein